LGWDSGAPFGRAGEKGMYWNTRADDLAVKATIGLMERNGGLPAARVAARAEGVRLARSRMLYRRTSQLQHTRPRGQEEASPILEDASDVIVGSLGRMWSRKHDRS
jgi:hypothetical protein